MKSPIEILHEINRLKDVWEAFSSSGQQELARQTNAKIQALEWVLSEKP